MRFIVLFLISCAGFALTNEEEQNAVKRYFWSDERVIKNIDINFYINAIAGRLGSDFRFFVFEDNAINAFATEYDMIGIYSGLIRKTKSEEELLAVMAHEIGHIKLAHFERMTHKSNDLLTLGGVVLAGTVGHPELTQAILSATIAGSLQQQINWTREFEVEADNYARKLFKEQRLNSGAISDFFLSLETDADALEYLQTHPLSINRAAQSYELSTQTPKKDSVAYTTLKALLSEKQTNYTQSLALFEKGKFTEALQLLTKNDLPTRILKGRILAKLGKLTESIAYLSDDNILSRYYLAEAYYQNKHAQQALQILKQQNYKEPNYYYYQLLANIYLSEEHLDKYHYTLAEQALFIGDSDTARLQLRLARTHTQNENMLLKINAKITQLPQDNK